MKWESWQTKKMFTKYHFTLTVIMLINLCGCYTVTPSAKTASIGGKDCKIDWKVSNQRRLIIFQNYCTMEIFQSKIFFCDIFNPCLVVGNDVRHSYIFFSFIRIQFHFHLKRTFFFLHFFFHRFCVFSHLSFKLRDFVSRVWILRVLLHVTKFFHTSIVDGEVCASHNAMRCWIMCEYFSPPMMKLDGNCI